MTFLEFILILIGILSIYNFLLYPIILVILKNISPNIIEAQQNYKPDITVFIAAYNEEELIEGAIKSIFNSSYPKNKINILVGSDGSTDKTNKILEKLSTENNQITYLVLERGGKNNVLNTLVPLVKTDIILFMDADIRIHNNTIENLVTYFHNDNVGAVIASQTVKGDGKTENAGSVGDSLYHRYEEKIRINEGITDSNVNSLGYLYGMRKDLYSAIPNNFVCDDLHNIYSVLQKRKRVLFSINAKAYEIRQKSLSNEFHRRVRAVAGGWATILYHKNLLNIFDFGLTSFYIWSHKVFRFLSPIFFILLFVVTLLNYKSTLLFLIFLIPQLIVYLSALLGWIFEKIGIKYKLFRLSLFFISMNYSSLLGFFRFISRQQNAIWDREGFNK